MKQRKRVIVINTETTGLDAKTDELLRITILSESGKVIFDEYVCPTKHVEWPEAQKIHHISPEMVKNSQPILYYLKELNGIINNTDVIVGYNHSFDMSFLAEAGIYSDPRKNYDLMLEFSQLIGEWDETRNAYKFFKLKECADYLGYRWSSEKDHDCLEDCKATLYCYKKLVSGESDKGGAPNRRQFQSAFIAAPRKISGPAILGALAAVVALIIIAFSLISSVKEDRVLREIEAGQENDLEYITYSNLKAIGALNKDGYYQHHEDTEASKPSGDLIHVTFAKNSYMDIRYYRDEALKEEIDTVACYLAPGDKIYIGDDVRYHDLTSNMYELGGFEIRELDDNGKAEKIISQPLSSNISMNVPESCHEICIVPIGKFKNRLLHLNAYYYGINNERNDISGVWTANDVPYDNSTGINPLIDYQVRCNFGAYAQTYYFVSAYPKYQFDEKHSEIIFDLAKTTDEDCDYSVELHPYIGLTVKDREYSLAEKFSRRKILFKIEIERSGKRRAISFKDGEIVEADELSNLKHGDIIFLTLDSSYQIISGNANLSVSRPQAGSIKGTDEYHVQIPKNNYSDLQLLVADKNSTSSDRIILPTISNAVVSLKYDKGYPIHDGDAKPNEGEKVILTITADTGYYLDGKGLQKDGSFSKTMKYAEYENSIEEILQGISVRKYVMLNLFTEDQYGSCIYKLDKKEVSGSVQAKEGQKLVIEFKVNPDSHVSVLNEKGKAKNNGKVEIVVSAGMDDIMIYPSDKFQIKKG